MIPHALRAKVENRPNLIKALSNIAWLFADKVLRMGVGLLVSVWAARYLGPHQFGLMSYCLAIVALFGTVANLGLNGIVVRDLVRTPESSNEIIGSAFLLQLFGGAISFGLAILAISLAKANDNLAKIIVIILAFTLLFKCTDVVRYWFESQVSSKYIVWLENSIFLAMAAIKISLILIKASLMAFIYIALIESLLVSFGLLLIYIWKCNSLSLWKIKADRMKALLRDGWPLIVSGLAVMVYMRIDQIMLGQMLGNEAVGIYTAAIRISEVWYFFPTIIISSAMPAIIAAKKSNPLQYIQSFQKLYSIMSLLALVVAIPMSFMSNFIASLLFGNTYLGAGDILAVHIWASIFVSLGMASSQWLILEGRHKDILFRTILGALINVCANLLLIPTYGAIGAAYATVFSYFIAVFSVYFRTDTRLAATMMARSIILEGIFRRKHA